MTEERNEKTHKNCGGEVVWREPSKDRNAHFEMAGLCLKCGIYPITLEDIDNFEE
nr:MAG: hypothetical protein [uncultured archaeon]